MTEQEAIVWLSSRFDVPRETLALLRRYVYLVIEESHVQNLIAPSTADRIWQRHVIDSAQLATFAPIKAEWIDLGSGAGLPGVVVALLHARHVSLVESRRLRFEFLKRVKRELGLGSVEVIGNRVEAVPTRTYDVISARAFAPLPKLLTLAHGFSTPETTWVLPKGRSAQAELDAIAGSWQGDFRIEPSVTDPESGIIVATRVQPRKHQ